MATTTRSPSRARTLGAYAPMLVLLLLAGLAVEEGLRLLLTIDPAAQADMAGWYILVLGVVLAATTAYSERPSVTEGTGEDAPGDSDDAARPATPYRDMTICLLLVAAYAALLATLGYVLAGVVVVFVFLHVISRYGWIKSTVYTLVMNAVFIALFELSGVVLPAGILRF
ncbi:tripartite tricarboxylate transporter TctB family protein [Prauserella cavernicola]|uniref:Tripartite tricarboxylate transporter TctB family protein n=1 Tax=Prauserella cavernicola TaxID=2800127 RepID=A0A934QNS0_9PSEU|nr:tripartite tricarboxylate transporter TctB family protein [Prauserella cavernicola]MBK1783243.1 tripartite tricarboxylate transporter TctB family protein [Prauserella cavernicola]